MFKQLEQAESRPVSLYLPEFLLEEMDEIANKDDLSRSAVVRLAILNYLKEGDK